MTGEKSALAPDFLERFGPISEPNDLRKLPSICLDISGRPSGQQWKFADASGEQITVRHTPVLFCNDIECAISACAAGIGVCSFYDYHVSDELRSGALVRVLADYSPPPHPIHLLRPPTVKMPLRIDKVISFLEKELRQTISSEQKRWKSE